MARIIGADGTIVPLEGDLYADGSITLRPILGTDGYMIGAAAGAGGGVSAHAATHASGASDPLNISTLPGTARVDQGGTGLTALAAGALRYGSGGAADSVLPIGAAGTFVKSTGAAPSWAALSAADVGSGQFALARMPRAAIGKVLRALGAGVDPAYSTFTVPDTWVDQDMVVATGANTLGAVAKPSATSVLTHTGSAYAWALALAKAQQHAQTAYLDAIQTFTQLQTLEGGASSAEVLRLTNSGDTFPRVSVLANGTHTWGSGSAAGDLLLDRNAAGSMRLRSGTNASVLLTLRPQNTVGGAGGVGGFTFFDGSASAGSFVGNFNLASGSRNFGFDAFSDRDGNRLPLFLSTQNAIGNSTRAFTIFSAADAGKLGLGTNVGVNLGTGVVPSAVLHVVETSGGALTKPVRIGNQSGTTGSAVGIALHAGASGVENIGLVQAILNASAVGDVVLSAQAASGAGPVERVRARGNGPIEYPDITAFPLGSPSAGKVWIASIGGALKAKTPSGTVTTLAV